VSRCDRYFRHEPLGLRSRAVPVEDEDGVVQFLRYIFPKVGIVAATTTAIPKVYPRFMYRRAL